MKKQNEEPVTAQTPTAPVANAKVQTTMCTQLGNAILGTEDKQLYYLIVETDKGKCVINIGQKTHDTIFKITA